MLYKEQIHNFVQTHKEEIIETLKELIKIPSIRGVAEKNAPFGKECARVLGFAQELYKKNGFKTELNQNDGYLLSYYGDGEKSLGIFAHADVVPVSDDWILTSPFDPIEKDGFIVGRGVLDDKSAIVISLYCAKMLKELSIPFNSRLILFTGANEESGMADIQNYVLKHTPPDFSLVADTAFPLYRGNKGQLLFNAVCDFSFDEIKKITAGNAKGAILGKFKITFEYNKDLYDYLKLNENERVAVTQENNEIVFEVCGISKHTALPEGSLNAGGVAFDILSKCDYLSQKSRRQFEFISNLLSNYYGETIGVENIDADFGRLTFVNDIIAIENEKLNLHFNLRFGAAVDVAQLKQKIEKEFSEKNWEIEYEYESATKITDINNLMLQRCLSAYKEFTQDNNAPVYVNAGGTYARYLPCAIEIGTTLHGGCPEDYLQGHGAVHQPDECINIDGFLDAIELTLLMLLKCDQGE